MKKLVNLLVLLIIFSFVSGYPTIGKAKEPSKSESTTKVSLGYLVKSLQETGLIGRINIETNEVWVDENMWDSTNVSDKENIIRLLSQYFNEKRGYERVTVYGWHSGKILAKKGLTGINFY